MLADAYEQDLGLVTEGDTVVIQVPAYPGEKFAGRVGHIGEVVDPGHPYGQDPLRRPEQGPPAEAGDVREGRGQRQRPAQGDRRSPSKAVLTDGDKTYVIVATEGNVFRIRRVDVGPESEGHIRVLGGLTPGEKIVTEGAIFMKREIENQ